jgi:hypothetical protein
VGQGCIQKFWSWSIWSLEIGMLRCLSLYFWYWCQLDIVNPSKQSRIQHFIAWKHNKKGRYSIRSGYHLQWRHTYGSRANLLALPSTIATNPAWKSLWKLKVQSKPKIFVWRALHGIIPLKSILVNRHIGSSGAMSDMYAWARDVAHLLFQCDTARQNWWSIGITNIIHKSLLTDRAGSAVF